MRASSLALLEDRVLAREGHPQRYGTQFQQRGGMTRPLPMEEAVHARRAEVGLQPLEDYAATLSEVYGVPAFTTPWLTHADGVIPPAAPE